MSYSECKMENSDQLSDLMVNAGNFARYHESTYAGDLAVKLEEGLAMVSTKIT